MPTETWWNEGELRNSWAAFVSKWGIAKERERLGSCVKEKLEVKPPQKRVFREIRRVHSGMSHRGLNSSKPAGRRGKFWEKGGERSAHIWHLNGKRL